MNVNWVRELTHEPARPVHLSLSKGVYTFRYGFDLVCSVFSQIPYNSDIDEPKNFRLTWDIKFFKIGEMWVFIDIATCSIFDGQLRHSSGPIHCTVRSNGYWVRCEWPSRLYGRRVFIPNHFPVWFYKPVNGTFSLVTKSHITPE